MRNFRLVRSPHSIRSYTHLRRKRRIRSSIISSAFVVGGQMLLIPHFPHPHHPSDKPPIRRRRHLCQSQRRRPKNSYAEDPPRARRKGRGHAENLRYSTRHPFSHFSSFFFPLYAQILLGKATLFVANQGNFDALPEQKFKDLAGEIEALNERNKELAAEVKATSAGMSAHTSALSCTRHQRRGAEANTRRIYAANRAAAWYLLISDFITPQSWRRSRARPLILSLPHK